MVQNGLGTAWRQTSTKDFDALLQGQVDLRHSWHQQACSMTKPKPTLQIVKAAGSQQFGLAGMAQIAEVAAGQQVSLTSMAD